MNKRIKSVLAGLIIAALVFLLYHELFPNKGKGLFRVHYLVAVTSDPSSGEAEGPDIMGDVPVILKQRINNLGHVANIKLRDNNRLDITVAHVHDTSQLIESITRSNKIEFKEVYTLDDIPKFFEIADKAVSKIAVPGNKQEKSIYSFLSPTIAVERAGVSRLPAAIGAVNKKDTAMLGRILRQTVLLESLPPGLQFRYGILTDVVQLRNNPDDIRLFAIKPGNEKEMIQNDDIENAELEFSDYSDLSTILIHFNRKGRQKWERITTESVGRYLAVMLDGMVLTAPIINKPIHGGDVKMHTGLNPDQARTFSEQLTMGLLPGHLNIVQSETKSEYRENGWARVAVSLIAFVITAALAMLVFNSLKNR